MVILVTSYWGLRLGGEDTAGNVIEKIRAAVGQDFLLASRIGVFDGVPYFIKDAREPGQPWPYSLPYSEGFGINEKEPLEPDLTEPKKVIGLMQQLGVGLINVSIVRGNSAGIPRFTGRRYSL